MKLLACLLALLGALAAPAPTVAASADNYILQPNDLVEIRVYQEDELNTTARLAGDGSITFPLIGNIALGGKTVSGALSSIRGALARDYLVNPQVTLAVKEFAKRRLTVIGQVQRGGTLLYPENETVTLLQAIGLAGGYTKIADPGKIIVTRRVEGKDTIFKLSAKGSARAGVAGGNFEILPGDVVTVGESLF